MKVQRFFAILAACFLAMTMSITTVMADSGGTATAPSSASREAVIDESRSCSLTIHKIKENSGREGVGYGVDIPEMDKGGMKGITFTAVRIGTFVTDVDSGTVRTLFKATGNGEKLLKLAADRNVTVSVERYDGSSAFSTEQAKSIVDGLCAQNSAEAGNASPKVAGEVAVNTFAKDCVSTNAAGSTAADNANNSDVYTLTTDESGCAVCGKMAQGLYLVAETDYANYLDENNAVVASPSQPFLVSLPMTNQTAVNQSVTGSAWMYQVSTYPKNMTISIAKMTARTANGKYQPTDDAEIGQETAERIVSDVPAILSGHNYEHYEIRDVMTEGMELKGMPFVSIGERVENPFSEGLNSGFTKLEGCSESDAAKDAKDFYLKRDDADQNREELNHAKGHSFSIVFTKKGLEKLNQTGDKTGARQIAVDFHVVLTEKAEDGGTGRNANVPVLIWKNHNTEMNQRIGNETDIFSYRLKIVKSGLTDFTKVGFEVSRQKDTAAQSGSQTEAANAAPMRFIEEADGIYFPVTEDSGTGKTNGGKAVTVLHPDHSGTLTLRGLDAETYTVREVSTAVGKELLKEPFSVTLVRNSDETLDGKLSKATLSVGGREKDTTEIDGGTATIHVVNYNSLTLRTGGRTFLLVIGAAAVLFAVGLAGLQRKKKRA